MLCEGSQIFRAHENIFLCAQKFTAVRTAINFPPQGRYFASPRKFVFLRRKILLPAEVGGFVFGQKKGPDWIPAEALAYMNGSGDYLAAALRLRRLAIS